MKGYYSYQKFRRILAQIATYKSEYKLYDDIDFKMVRNELQDSAVLTRLGTPANALSFAELAFVYETADVCNRNYTYMGTLLLPEKHNHQIVAYIRYFDDKPIELISFIMFKRFPHFEDEINSFMDHYNIKPRDFIRQKNALMIDMVCDSSAQSKYISSMFKMVDLYAQQAQIQIITVDEPPVYLMDIYQENGFRTTDELLDYFELWYKRLVIPR